MKRFNLFLIAVILLGGVATAQHRGGKTHKNVTPEVRAQKMTDRMAKELSLDEAQASKIQAINLEFLDQRKSGTEAKQECNEPCTCQKHNCDKSKKADKAEMKKVHEYMKAARESRDLKLKSVLTKEQYVQYEKNKEEQKKNKKGKGSSEKLG